MLCNIYLVSLVITVQIKGDYACQKYRKYASKRVEEFLISLVKIKDTKMSNNKPKIFST